MLFYSSEKYPKEDEYSKFISEHGGFCNAFTSAEWLIRTHGAPGVSDALHKHVTQSGLTYRARDSIVRVARTLADLDDQEFFSVSHIHQAAELRCAPLQQ